MVSVFSSVGWSAKKAIASDRKRKMAATKCTGCGAHIAVRGLSSCPKCSAPIAALADERVRGNSVPVSGQISTGRIYILPIVGMVAAISLLALFGWRIMNPSEEKLRARAISVALANCQTAIASTAKFGNSDTPPAAKNYGSTDDEFYFAWPRGSFEFSNAFGGRVKMSASCTGKLTPFEIQHLTINGADIK